MRETREEPTIGDVRQAQREAALQVTEAKRAQGREQEHDVINHPSHYTFGGIEVLDAIEAWGVNYHLGNVIKYVVRHEHKNGVEDLKKARFYLDRYIARAESTDQ